MRSATLEHKCRGDVKRNSIWNLYQLPGRHDRVFRITTRAQTVCDAVSGFYILDSAAGRLNHSGTLHAWCERQLGWVDARVAVMSLAHVNVHEVQARVVQLDEHLVIPRFGRDRVDELQ